MENEEEVVIEEETPEEEQEEVESVKVPKADYDKLNETVGSLKRELKDLKKPKESQETPQNSNEPDYAKLGFLNSVSVTHPDDQKIVIDEAKRLKLPLTDVLQMEHIKSKLATNNDTRVSQDGMPKGSGRKGGPGKSTVDYYLAHPDEVPDDLELHGKVIDARMKQETNANKFSSTPFIG